MQHIEFARTSSDGLEFFFQGWQPQTAPKAVVCLVHGLGEHSGRYAHVAEALTDSGYALLSFDLRGHGKSGGRRGHTPTYDTLMGDIGRLLEEAQARYPDLPCFLYGHSMGGGMVLNFALRRSSGQALRCKPTLSGEERNRRVAGVIATSPWLRLSFVPPTAKMRVGKIMSRVLPTFMQSSGLNPVDLSRDPEVARAYAADPFVHDRISARLGVAIVEAGAWAIAHAAEFPLPLLLTHGSADQVTSAVESAEFAKKVPGDCTFKLWDGFYHETHNEPEKIEVLGFMIAWLQQHTPA